MSQARVEGPFSARSVLMFTSQSVFSETSADFDACMEYHKTTETARIYKLRRRVKNLICPKVV
jgi:hypothetical protein